ncbi:MAG TPA: helix-turn-helix domain-containing protein [Opitutaceae bacterium]|nr:helix-turn-helix domain-containing protein [Opitutaceae bacterium]
MADSKSLDVNGLEEIANRVRPLEAIKPPPQGWLRAVRKTLDLSAREVAETLGISTQLIYDFEEREAAGTLTLANLRKAAKGMNCEVVYFVVPKSDAAQ